MTKTVVYTMLHVFSLLVVNVGFACLDRERRIGEAFVTTWNQMFAILLLVVIWGFRAT